MMSLFDKNSKYTEEASVLDKEVYEVLRPIIEKYAEYGYSIREIAHIAMMTVLEIECMIILDWDMEREKENVGGRKV